MLLIYRAKIKFLIFFYVCECMIIKHYYYLVYTIYSQRRVTKLFFLNTQNLNKTEAFKTVFFFCCKTTKYKMIENEMKWTKSVDFSFYIFTVVNSNQNTTQVTIFSTRCLKTRAKSLGAQLYTSLKEDLSQDINGGFAFSRRMGVLLRLW